MRRILVALLTALTVVIGLFALTVGTAQAAPGDTLITVDDVTVDLCLVTGNESAIASYVDSRNNPNADQVTTADVLNALKGVSLSERRQGCSNSGGGGNRTSCADYARDNIYDIPRSDPRYRSSLDRDNDGVACERNEGNGGNNGGPIYNGPRYNSCADYNRNNIYDIRRGDARWNDSWDRNRNGIACDRQDVIVSDDGRCVTFRDQNRDYGTRYNSLYNERIDRARSINSDGGTRITNNETRAIEDAAALRDYRNRWTSTRDELRTICNDPTPEVQIITVPAPAPVTVTAAPPAPAPPVSSSGGGGSIPRGSVNTGGWDVQSTLAHNRLK